MIENEEDFFNIDDEFDSLSKTNSKIEDVEEEDFDFDTDEIDDANIEDEIDEVFKETTAKDIKKEYKRSKKISDDYKRGKLEVKDSIDELKGNISAMVDNMPDPEDMFLQPDLLPGLDMKVDDFDYIQEIEIIKIDSKDTLESIANLYIDLDKMKNKNIHKIIKNDADNLADLNFSISMARRALISVMKQIDMGVDDPLAYQSVAMFQKEMRDTIKLTYDLQKKMMTFYKSLKNELPEINTGVEEIKEEENEDDQYTIIGDPKLLNQILEQYEKDPSLLKTKKDDKK